MNFSAMGGRQRLVEKYVEEQKERFLSRVYQLENPFYLAFYEQSIECIVADAYEFFAELRLGSNFFYSHAEILNEKRGVRLFRLMAAYHTIRTVCKKRNLLSNEEMREVLFSVFQFDEREQKLYHLLYDCARGYQAEFQGVFNHVFIKYIFGIASNSPFALAFIQYFCYNSYQSFMQSFTKYMSFNRRIQKMVN